MADNQIQEWKQTIFNIKKEFPHLHITYHSKEGWANITFKTKSVKIYYFSTKEYIANQLQFISKG